MNVDIPLLIELLGIQRARLRGDEWWAPCPLHKEKKPSWSIADAPGTDRHGSWYCWGCGRAGGPVDLASEVIGNTRGGATRWMREKGILKQEELKRLGVSMKMVVARNVQGGFQFPFGVRADRKLQQWATPARRYVVERGIPEWQVDKWALAYAVEGPLEGRLIVPVKTSEGQLVCYHARTFVGQDAKYLYPKPDEGANYDHMFGAQHWPRKTRSSETLFLAEGAFDAMACERVGARYIGALGGACAWVKSGGRKVLRAAYVMLLAGWGRVVLVTDNDAAGDGLAAEVQRTLQRWVDVRRATMPQGVDAAQMAKDDPRKLEGLLRGVS